MGKWTDKGYITHSEWVNDFGYLFYINLRGAKAGKREVYKKLPFHCCALSLQPWQNPFCTPKGTIYDLVNILPWIKQYKSDPVSGNPLDPKSLIKLIFSKSETGEYHCPITFKVFNEHSHIVAIKSTGNVYSNEAIQTLIIDQRNFRDLMTDEPITRSDFITLQDPNSVSDKNISEFYYFKNDLKVDNLEKDREKKLFSYRLNAQGTTSKILNEYHSKQNAQSTKKEEQSNTEKALSAHYSTGRMAASLTSTAMNPVTRIEQAKVDAADYMSKLVSFYILVAHVKGKGYATFETNLGDIRVELYCQDTPKTCYNFIALAKKGYYKNVKFHRNIRNLCCKVEIQLVLVTGENLYMGSLLEMNSCHI
jgi:peptidyl-prolyl cis-trans isomerase-like protein 2